ncbi:GNAT family N-acetyltransferase [Kitasatospora sp. NPDC056800]|uniref:GNAT family N-acetyltransferase n=1 Tax=Kitasatospora sp. NPDC056800 TaxID=3345948 RepID=UPI0036B14A3B
MPSSNPKDHHVEEEPPVFRMREATAADAAAIADMIRERSRWLSERGLGECEAVADEFGAQAANPDIPVWVLEHRERGVVGCTTIMREDALPLWGFTDEERAEPSLFLTTSFTRPNPYRLGRLLAWWALDHAAVNGIRWVRRGTAQEQLSRYYQRGQGWQLLRVADLPEAKVHLLQRRAERLPELPGLMSGRALREAAPGRLLTDTTG